MTNKYLVQRSRRNALIKANTFLTNEFCLPLKIPKMLYIGFKKVIKVYLRRLETKGYNTSKPIYNYLEVPSSCFKSRSNMVRSY